MVVPVNTGEFIASMSLFTTSFTTAMTTLTSQLTMTHTKIQTGFMQLVAGITKDLTSAAMKMDVNFVKLSKDMIMGSAKLSADITKFGAGLKLDMLKNTKDLIFQDKIRAQKQALDDKQSRWKNFMQRVAQFGKAMSMFARVWPIIKVAIVLIIIFGNLLFYVIMVIAWLGAAILEVIYFIISLPPFIQAIWLLFFLISDGIPFILYTMVFGGLLILILFACVLMLVFDIVTAGKLRDIVLCQNNPAAWYKVPVHHLYNKFERGIMCSRPCKKNYYPNETGTSCLKLPKESPSFCPQAQIMRFYSGDGKKDGKYMFAKMKTKSNMNYLSKPPEKREQDLLGNFIEKRKFLQECNNPDNPMGMTKYDPLTLNICSNIESMTNSDTAKFDPKIFPKLNNVCSQGFCDSRATYPFCTRLNKVSDTGSADLIKKIILAMIAMIAFTVTIIIIFAYANEV